MPELRCPGLFVTGTDTGVGKTVVTCAVAWALRRQLGAGARVGVCKPFATGCRRDREGLVSEDAEALAHWSDCRQPLDVINPVRFARPLAPAVAAEQAREAVAWPEVARSLAVLDGSSEALLVEGVGGPMVPLDPASPRLTVVDLAEAVGYPVLIVARSVLGTLSHTAMAVSVLKARGLRVAGIVMNGYDVDAAAEADPSVATNRVWLERLTGVRVVAVSPRVPAEAAQPQRGVLDASVLESVATAWWPDVLKPQRR